MSRILAIDFGTKRCGIAITDELRMIASGLTTVETADLMRFLHDYCKDEKVGLIVVGQPLQKDGTPSDVEVNILEFIEKLREEMPEMPIDRTDERFSSKLAVQAMIDSGLKKKKRRNKALIDGISATIILQDYMKNI